MKKILFAFPVLALAIFLAYCAKDNRSSDMATTPLPVSDRGGGDTGPCEGNCEDCCISITADEDIIVCGLSSNNAPCPDCAGVSMNPGRDVGTGPFTYCVDPPALGIPFSIRNASTTNTALVTISYGGGVCTWQVLPSECLQFNAASTCLLFNTQPPVSCQ